MGQARIYGTKKGGRIATAPMYGALGRIRTSDRLVRSQILKSGIYLFNQLVAATRCPIRLFIRTASKSLFCIDGKAGMGQIFGAVFTPGSAA